MKFARLNWLYPFCFCAFGLNVNLVQAQLPPLDYTYIPNLPTYGVPRVILQDHKGLLWFGYGSSDAGLYKFDGISARASTIVVDSITFSGVHINTLAKAPDGTIIIGTATQGIFLYHPLDEKFTKPDYSLATKIQIDYVHHAWVSTDGYWWLACVGGLIRYDPSRKTFTHYMANLPGSTDQEMEDVNHLRHIIQDPADENMLWLGSLRGLVSFNKKTGQFQHHLMPFSPIGQIGFPHAQFMIIDMLFSDSTMLIMGSWAGGILMYDTKHNSWRQCRDPRIPPENDVYYDIEMKDDSTLWIASNFGFGTFDLKTHEFAYYDLIPSAESYRGNLRLASAIKQLNERDIIVLGSKGGMLGHFRNRKPTNEQLFPPLVNAVYIDNVALPHEHLHHLSRKISMGPQEQVLSFSISGPTYFRPDQVRYRYQLIGHDRTWQLRTGGGLIKYENLNGGKYQLQYQASLDGTSWLDGAPWEVEKYVPFWQSTQLKFVLLSSLFAGLGLYMVLRQVQRRKRITLERSFKHRIAESEMSALRAQMNPHFIFNSLNSIKTFVLQQDTMVANHYLTRFSHLMRMVLKNSKSKLITLADELQALELYIDMEKLRFDNGFECIIERDERIDPEGYYLPPMLVQPYVENAIWHGLLHKKDKGRLLIKITKETNSLHILIEDNGIGRRHSALLRNKPLMNKSFGTQITQDRITLIREALNIDAHVRIEDLYGDKGSAEGTRVHLIMPHLDAQTAKLILDQPNTA